MSISTHEPESPGAPASRLRRRATGMFAGLIAANLTAWIAAFTIFAGDPVMLGTALLAWSLGLRHAVDADHIAAIDNVTRKLMQDGQRPLTVGFWFAIGHSGIVLIAAVAIAVAASALSRVEAAGAIGGTIATMVSATFLFAIAAMNLIILRSVLRTFNHVRKGGAYVDEDMDILLGNRGLLARLFRPLFRLVTRSWHMAPLGFLFGLGFDTATEVAILGLSAGQAASGLSVATVLIFPLLFAAGMALIDTADGALMMGAYQWAFVKPIRKLYYNITITLVSALVALLIGGIEAAALLGDKLGLSGGVWTLAADLGEHFNSLGFIIIGLFAACWLLSWAIYRWKGFDEIEVAPIPSHQPQGNPA
ncbi:MULTISPECIES: HoxN/HupN/NixA family nickel/cobalt transporter [Sphingobium]|jgi:high-affinity nickel-transport protein|uniref:Nickel/cobalt efflux system n=1 Tax=Sphingobium fuliginis (strain ATCC 27551) TaxID=336203 RepID=A0A292ZN14_SPHSA|nr:MULTISPECIES: HoxN/HupN/NixA family nickel/cobalt transporter [Sphingobium]QOT74080.1 HoxN/HupN/NixA family nickel/cobalt transporter [Sphingobium fuliginis]UXC93486.1 HoxN/HupN/NixA family nickel/cobalt transporter [Sphingobium sp. RSMS]GAY24273.1 HoxN/HupN/NixA family cobalt transporter [Sphingobium fuliginis]